MACGSGSSPAASASSDTATWRASARPCSRRTRLSEQLGSQRFGTSYRYRDPRSGLLDGDFLPVDLAANAASLGTEVVRAATAAEFRAGLAEPRAARATTVVYVETDPLAPAPSSEGWWDVPVAEVSALASTQKARAAYEAAKRGQRLYL
jgi:3D-(3,5/4)-trihydroxycyclohexane-1,2-dione acylhydrolase (decyclizing)